MSRPRIGAIIPVKTFSRAKTRLHLTNEKTEQICKIMLESVLRAVSQSNILKKAVIVSKDEAALKIGKKFGAVGIYEEKELGVNNAVLLADRYFSNEGFDATVVFPQDIPLIQVADIKTLIDFRMSDRCVLVVPSRKFDGTNALFRMPLSVTETHYDEDSYKIHLEIAEKKEAKTALVLISRIMWDVDDESDLNLISTYDLPVAESIRELLELSNWC